MKPIGLSSTLLLFILCVVTSHAGEFTVSTNSYLGGPGDLEEIRGARVQSDGTIVLGAVIGSAAPGGLVPTLLNGSDPLTPAAVVRLSQDGQTVLSVTRLSQEIWDLSVDGSDNIYVAAGTEGMVKLDPTATSIVYQKRVGDYIYRVDAAPNGDVACLQPSNYGPDNDGVRIEDNTPGVGTIYAYDAGGSPITSFDTWSGRHAVDVAIFDGDGVATDARISVIGWRNGYAYTGPSDACSDSLVNGISTTVHIGSIFGFTYNYDGTNGETELAYRMYDRAEGRSSIWLNTTPATLKDRRQEHANPEFFNGPTNLSDLYTLADIDAARTDGLNWNDWLWIEEDAGNSFVGSPKNIIYQEAFDWYQKGFSDSVDYIDSTYLYPGWCDGRNNSAFVGYPYDPGGNNMADTRGLRISMGRDGKLYGLFESAGGNTELRWDPFDLSITAPNAAGDIYHQFLNIGSAHATTIGRYEPVSGNVELIQEYASNYINTIGQTISNTTRAKGGDIAADERGRVYFVGVSAGELPIPLAANYNSTPGFNPYPEGYYMGGAYLIVLRPDMSGREYATRLAFGYTHAVDARILGADPLNDPATIVFAGKDELGGPMWLKNPVQANPGFGAQDGYFAVLGGPGSSVGDTYTALVGEDDWPAASYQHNFRGVNQADSTVDADNDGNADDRRSAWDFSDTVPLSDGNPDYTGLPFYGGFEFFKLDSTSTNLFGGSRTGIKDDGLGHGTSSSAANANLLVYFDKADLPGIVSGDRLSFSRNTRPSVAANQNRQWRDARFVVRNGSQFYVAEESGSDFRRAMNFVSDNDDGRWAEFDPASSLEFDQDNAVYANRDFQNITGFGFYSDRDSTANNIGIYTRLTDFFLEFSVNATGNSAPVAVASADPQLVTPGDSITLDGTASGDPDGTVTFHAWDFNDDDGSANSGAVVTTSYPAPGLYHTALTVYDASLSSDVESVPVYVGPDASRGADLNKVIAAYDGIKDTKDWRKSQSTSIDLDGDSFADDSWLGATFSETEPVESRNSTSLYGGFIGEWFDDTNPRFDDFKWQGTAEVRSKSGSSHWVHAALFIDQSDFIRGGDVGTVSFDAGAYIEIHLGRNDLGWPFRWLVRQGSTYYVSQATFSTAGTQRYTFAGGSDGMWAVYDPATDINFDASSASFAPVTFDDVTAFGVVVDDDDTSASRGWMTFEYLMAEATVTPFVNAPPIADFSYTPASPAAPAIVSFDASTSTDDRGIVSVRWDFDDGSFIEESGDGTTPPPLTVDHSYQQAGDYDVTLTLIDESGATDTQTQTVTVSGTVVTRATFSATPANGTAPLSVTFDASASTAAAGTSITSYDWIFGDGTTLPNGGTTPSHTYTHPGTYYASLTITDSLGGNDNHFITIIVDQIDPTAVLNANPIGGTAPLLVNFDGSASTPGSGTITDYIWNFGDGNGASGSTSSHNYATAGLYIASLTVFNSMGGSDVEFVQINVLEGGAGNQPPVASLTTIGSPNGSVPHSVDFDASASSDPDGSIVRYDWDFGDGSTLDDAGPTPPSHSYTASGTYNAIVTVTDDLGGQDTDSVSINVGNEVPSASFTFSPTLPTPGESISFDASASSDPDGTIVSYDWNFGDGTILSDAGSTPSHSFATEDTFTVVLTVTDNEGATDQASTVISTIPAGEVALLYHYTFEVNGGIGTTVNDVSGFGVAADATSYVNSTPTQFFTNATSSTDGSFYGNFEPDRSSLQFSIDKWNDDSSGVAGGSDAFTITLLIRDFDGTSVDADGSNFFQSLDNDLQFGFTGGTGPRPLHFRANNGSRVNTSASADLSNTTTGESNGWIMLAMTYSSDTDTAHFYLGREFTAAGGWNLSLVESIPYVTGSLSNEGNPLSFGDNSARDPDAKFDDLRIYNGVLSQEEIAAIGASSLVSEIPVATLTNDATDWIISIPSQTGFSYQIRTFNSLDTSPSTWDPVGTPQSGSDGVTLEFRLPKSNWTADPKRFFTIEVNSE